MSNCIYSANAGDTETTELPKDNSSNYPTASHILFEQEEEETIKSLTESLKLFAYFSNLFLPNGSAILKMAADKNYIHLIDLVPLFLRNSTFII